MKPIMKWVGGKRQLLPEILKVIPDYNNYYEAFIGGGAVLLELAPNSAVINDYNEELINLYKVVKNKHKKLIEQLRIHQANNSADYYYAIRDWDLDPDYKKRTDVERAARIMYMNKVCFNGLYRVNSAGHYNAPYGRYKNPRICNEEEIIAMHNYLKNNNVVILNMDFEKAVSTAKAGDFVYFDPPYYPLTVTSSFTSYSDNGFSEKDQIRLKEVCDDLTRRGVKFLLSNSCCPFIMELYKDYKITLVDASRAINSKGQARGKIKEVLVRNYE